MYFDFYDRYDEVEAVGSAISKREGVVLSVVVHVAIVLALFFVPQLPFFQPTEAEREAARKPPPQARPQFVMVEPLRDVPAPTPPLRADASDMDRKAQAPQFAERPENPLPFSRGDSSERTEALPDEKPRGQGPEAEPAPPTPRQAEDTLRLPDANNATPAAVPQVAEERPAGGKLGEALRDLQKYVQRDTFNNQQGGPNEFGPNIQFDTKGVEFGPWIRRFIAQVKRNWNIPDSALAMRGRVVVQFNVHRDGSITDINVVGPSDIDSFNRSSYNALLTSNPTQPLPPEYPADKAFFTVTFFYNESPSQQQ